MGIKLIETMSLPANEDEEARPLTMSHGERLD